MAVERVRRQRCASAFRSAESESALRRRHARSAQEPRKRVSTCPASSLSRRCVGWRDAVRFHSLQRKGVIAAGYCHLVGPGLPAPTCRRLDRSGASGGAGPARLADLRSVSLQAYGTASQPTQPNSAGSAPASRGRAHPRKLWCWWRRAAGWITPDWPAPRGRSSPVTDLS